MASFTCATRAMACCCLALSADAAWAGDAWVAVDAARLDQLRGGFTSATGLQIAVGIERMVSINGEVMSRASFSVTSAAGAAAVEQSGGRLIQQGSHNVFAASIDQAGATIIQNSLSNQTIRTDTLISANVNSAALMRDLNFQRSLGDAALASTGSH